MNDATCAQAYSLEVVAADDLDIQLKQQARCSHCCNLPHVHPATAHCTHLLCLQPPQIRHLHSRCFPGEEDPADTLDDSLEQICFLHDPADCTWFLLWLPGAGSAAVASNGGSRCDVGHTPVVGMACDTGSQTAMVVPACGRSAPAVDKCCRSCKFPAEGESRVQTEP